MPPTSTSKTAMSSPIGTAIRAARPVISSVPMMALRMPPPAALRSPGGSWVKKSTLMTPMPFETRYQAIAASGTSATTNAAIGEAT